MKIDTGFFKDLNKLLDRQFKTKIILLFLLSVVSIFFDLVGISMVIPMVLIIIQDKSSLIETFPSLESYITNYDKSEILIIAITLFLIFYLIKSLFVTFLTWYDKKFVLYSQVEFGEKLLLKYLSEDYLKFLRFNSGDLIRNVISESGIFVTSVIHNLINLLVEIILIGGIAILLMYFEPVGSTISIIFVTSLSLFYIFFFKKKLISLGKKRQEIDGTLIKNLNQAFTLFKEVRLFDKSKYLVERFRVFFKERAKISVFEQLVSALPRVYFEFIALLILTLVIYSFVYIKNDTSEIIPILSLYAASMFRLIPSANKIIGCINSLNHNLPAFDVIYNDLIKGNEISNSKETKFKKFNKFVKNNLKINSIKIENLNFSFSYEDKNNLLLKNINIEIVAGKITGLIGYSGCGKSTLANIISGLITNYEGQFFINDNQNINKKILQEVTGHVSQHVNLIDDSILNNICFGIEKKDINFDKVEKIVSQLNLNELISSLPGKIDSNIGEQGLKLSGGQRQKISLARTLYSEPKIIIFDESTSSLDQDSEKEFINVINNIKKDKIIFFISHNKFLEESFDEIYKIENQKLIRIK